MDSPCVTNWPMSVGIRSWMMNFESLLVHPSNFGSQIFSYHQDLVHSCPFNVSDASSYNVRSVGIMRSSFSGIIWLTEFTSSFIICTNVFVIIIIIIFISSTDKTSIYKSFWLIWLVLIWHDISESLWVEFRIFVNDYYEFRSFALIWFWKEHRQCRCL